MNFLMEAGGGDQFMCKQALHFNDVVQSPRRRPRISNEVNVVQFLGITPMKLFRQMYSYLCFGTPSRSTMISGKLGIS